MLKKAMGCQQSPVMSCSFCLAYSFTYEMSPVSSFAIQVYISRLRFGCCAKCLICVERYTGALHTKQHLENHRIKFVE